MTDILQTLEDAPIGWITDDGFEVKLWRGAQTGRVLAKVTPPDGRWPSIASAASEDAARAEAAQFLDIFRAGGRP